MAGDTSIVVIGNSVSDPEMRYTQNGLAVVNFTVASTPRHFDKNSNEWVDDEALFMRCSAWRDMAEHIAASIQKGTRVIVQGNLKQRSYDGKDGEKRTSMELDVTAIGPELTFATAQVTRASSNRNQAANHERAQNGRSAGQQSQGGGNPQGQNAGQGGQQGGGQVANEPWGQPAGGATYADSTPF